MPQKFVVVDLETTGNSFERGDRIIQLAIVVIENFQITDQYTTFVNSCGTSIPPFIQELTGIHEEMLTAAPTFSDVAEKIHKLLENSIFVAHNVLFDLNFLQQELTNAGYPNHFSETIDTVELAKILIPESPSYQLSELSELLGFVHDQPHQADSDARVTAEIFLLLIEKAKQLPIVTLEKLLELSYLLKSDIATLFQMILSDNRKRIENLPADIEVFRGIAIKKKSIPESADYEADQKSPSAQTEQIQLLQSIIENDPVLSGKIEMMDAIHDAFKQEKHAVIEAGAGTRNSLAYLIPALLFAIQNGQQVVVSTFTTQLQDQIVLELQKVSKVLPIRVSVLKGRHHYINLLKFEQTLKENNDNYETILTKMQILVWLIQTETGDLSEINLIGNGQLFKQRVKHDGWFLNYKNDPWFTKDFYIYAKELAKDADLIITNHTMLLLDMEMTEKIFPDYQFAIIDEAQHLEKSVRLCSGRRLTYPNIKFLLGRFLENSSLPNKLKKVAKDKNVTARFNELSELIIELDNEFNELFMLLAQLLVKHSAKTAYHLTKRKIGFTRSLTATTTWKSVVLCAERVYDLHKEINNKMNDQLVLLKQIGNDFTIGERAYIEEFHSFILQWTSIGVSLKEFIIQPFESAVVWLEGDIRSLPNSISIQMEPENSHKILEKQLFGTKKSVVLTSEALTVNGSFNYFLREIGLNDGWVEEKMISPPFNNKKHVKLIISTDLPDIRTTAEEKYIEAMTSHIIAIAEATNGRMFILFTSLDMLKKTYELIKESEALEHFALLAQGITPGSRSRLVKNFQRFNKSILFGTSSFWEGVDLSGKDLSCLIIVRLPFSSPEEPLIQAKYEKLRNIGLNPFTDYALPQAVLRFKQGVGRFVRSESDRGIVIIFDRRLDTSSYGQIFQSSLQNIPIEKGTISEIVNTIENWL